MVIIENHGQMSEVMENGDVNVFYPKTYASDVYIDNEGNNLDTLISQLFLRVHPIGCIYMTVDSTNPGTTYGGTWVSWGTGQVPVGVNTNDTSFNTVEKTGGEKSHTLTGAESGQKNLGNVYTSTVDINHYHSGTTGTMNQNWSHNHRTSSKYNGDGDMSKYVLSMNSWTGQEGTAAMATGAGLDRGKLLDADINHTHNFITGYMSANNQHNHYTTISASNATNAHNNLQPYITCYMFKRTA